jgi:general secretion pathway protein G
MAKSKCLRVTVVAALLVLFTASAAWAETAAKSAGDELLAMVPAESLFCVRINNFDYTLSQTDQFLAGVSPMPMGVSMLVRMQLAQLFGSPQLQGINMGGSFAIFATAAPGGSMQPDMLSILVPIADYKQFVSGNPNIGQPDEKGISKITGVGGLVTQVGKFALIKPPGSYDKLVALKKSISEDKMANLTSALDAVETKQASEQPIWAYGNIQQVSKTFGPLIFATLQQAKTAMAGMPSTGMGPIGSPEKIIDIYIKLLETLMKETKSLTIALNPKPDVLNITETITALPGTDMANMFVADAAASKENKLLGYLEDGAMMNIAAKVNAPCCKKLYDKAFDLFAPIFGDTITAEDIAKMKTLTADAIDSLTGPIAFSFSTNAKYKPPFAIKYVLEVKDADKFNRVIEESIALWNKGTLADFYKGFGMQADCTIKRAADSYKGVSIDSAKIVIKSTDPNSPQAQMLAAMYGDGFEYRWAIVDGLCVMAVGGDVDSTIRALVDQVKAGGPKQIGNEMNAALALLPEADKADMVGTFNYVRVLNMVPAMMGAMMPVPMPQLDIPTKSNIVFAGNVGNGKLTVDIAIPKQHLAEIMAAFQMMMQHQMQQQMKMQSTPEQSVIPEGTWTCPMHPHIRARQKGKCPVCSMDFVPVSATKMQPNVSEARVTATKANLMQLHMAVIQFKMDIGRFPTEQEGLTALIKKPSGVTSYLAGGYLDTTELPKDGWGRDFIYKLWPESGKPFVIISYGADGKQGGQGDDADLRSTDAY